MSKQHRPIDQYDKQFEDKEVEQGEELRKGIDLPELPSAESMIKANVERSVFTEESTQGISKEVYQSVLDPQDRYLANIEESGVLEGLTGEDNTSMDDPNDIGVLNSSNNWWNTFYNMIDEIDAERYKGQILEAETKIDNINTTLAANKEKLSSEEINNLIEQRDEWKTVIEEKGESLIDNQAQIDSQKVSESYKNYTDAMAVQEGSTFQSYAGGLNPFSNSYSTSGEMAKDLGGAFSDIWSMAVSIAAPMVSSAVANGIIASGVASGTAASAAGTPTGPGAALVGMLGFGVGALTSYGAQYHARENESYAEMYGAYEERVRDMEKMFELDNQRKPTEEEHAQIKKDARKGAASVLNHNMGLYMYDMAEAAVTLLPWSKHIKWLSSPKRWQKHLTQVGMVGAASFLSSINEGREEGDQYLIKNDYIKGIYDNDDIERLGIMARGGSLGILGSMGRAIEGIEERGLGYSGETLAALPQILLPGWSDQVANFAPGRTNTPEFRNSVRSGFSMGVLMGGGVGGAQAVWGAASAERDRYIQGNTLEEINPFLAEYLNDEQTRSKAYRYFQNFSDGKFKRMYKAIKNMDKLDLRTDEGINIQKELKTLEEHKSLYDMITGMEEYASLDNKEASDLFYTTIKMKNKLDGAMKKRSDMGSALDEAYAAKNFEGKPEGYESLLRARNKSSALKKLINEYKKLNFKGNKKLTENDKKLWEKKREFSLNYFKDELKATESLIDQTKDESGISDLKTLENTPELENRTKSLKDQDVKAAYYLKDYSDLRNPANGPLMRSNLRFKETQEYRGKGEKNIKDETVGTAEVIQAIPLENQQLTPGTTVRATNKNGVTNKGVISEDGKSVLINGDKIPLAEMAGWSIIPVESASEVVDQAAEMRAQQEAASAASANSAENPITTPEVNTQPGESANTTITNTSNSENTDVIIDLTDSEIQAEQDDFGISTSTTPPTTPTTPKDSQEQDNSEPTAEENQGQDPKEEPTDEELSRDNPQGVYRYVRNKINRVAKAYTHVANWVKRMTTEKMRNYTVSYTLNLQNINDIVKGKVKMNTGPNKEIKYSFIEKILPLILALNDTSKQIDISAWTKKRDGRGNLDPNGKFSFIGFLPINAIVLDSSGKVVKEDGKSVEFGIHKNNWHPDVKNPGQLHPQEKSLLKIKEEFLKNYSEGNSTYGLIRAKGKGLLNTQQGAKNAVASLFQDQPVRIGITKNGMIYQSNNIPLAVLTNEESLQSRTGGLYAVITLPDGIATQAIQLGFKNDQGKFQLPNRALSTKEIDVLYDIAKKIAISKANSSTAFSLTSTYTEKGFENLSADDILYLLLGTNKYRIDTANFKSLYTKKNPGVTINGEFISKQELLTKEGAVKFKTHAKGLVRNVHVQGLEAGANVTDLPGLAEKGVSVTFFGEEYEEGNSNYLTTFLKVDKTSKEGAIISTDVDASKGSLFQPAPVFLDTTVSSTWPGKIDSTFTSTGKVKLPKNIEAIISKLKNKSKRFALSADEKQYLEYETEEHKVVVARYDRVTSFTEKKSPDPSIVLDNASKIGTALDTVVRDFFAGNLKKWDEYHTFVKIEKKRIYSSETVFKSKELFDEFKKDLIQLSIDFERNGEYVVSEDIVVSDPTLGLAGTVDILTVTAEGKVRIYDMKTKRTPFTKLEKAYENSKSYITKWTNQLSLYKILLNNLEGLKAEGLGIIPIRVSYSDKVEDNQTSVAHISRGAESPWSGDDVNRLFMIELTPLDEINEVGGTRVAKLADRSIEKEVIQENQEEIIRAFRRRATLNKVAATPEANRIADAWLQYYVNTIMPRENFDSRTQLQKQSDGTWTWKEYGANGKISDKKGTALDYMKVSNSEQEVMFETFAFKETNKRLTLSDSPILLDEINRIALAFLKSEDPGISGTTTTTPVNNININSSNITQLKVTGRVAGNIVLEGKFEESGRMLVNENNRNADTVEKHIKFILSGESTSTQSKDLVKTIKNDLALDLEFELEIKDNAIAKEEQQNAQDLSTQEEEPVYEMAVDSVEAPEKLIDIDEEVAWIKRVLGNAVPVEVVNDIIKVGKNGGSMAYAIFHKSMITLSKRAPKGAGFHEAYHAVEELYLTPEEINQLNAETLKEYGRPEQLEINRVMRKWASAFGISLNEQEAINIIYSERRAEDFRVYQLTKGDRKSASSMANKFFKRILDWIKNIFSNELTAIVLFDRIEKGYYGKQTPISANQEQAYKSQVQLTMEIPGFSQTQIENITNSLLYYAIIGNSTGGFNRADDTNKVRIDTGLTKATLLKTLEGAKAREIASKTSDKTRIDNLQKVIDNIDFFIDNSKLELKKIGLREAKVAKDKNDTAQSLGDSNKDLASLKLPFESSNKDNATTNTRLVLSFLPKKVESKKTPGKYITVLDKTTGLPLIANPSHVWNTTEALMTGLVDYYNEQGVRVGAMTQMVEALRDYGRETDPTFLGLVDVLGNLSPTNKSAFHNTFAKTEHEFLTVLYSRAGEGEGRNFKFTFFNSNVQNKANRIYNSWKTNFAQLGILIPVKQSDGNYVYTINRKKLDALLAKHKEFEKNTLLPLYKGMSLDNTDLGNFINILKEVGIYIDLKGVKTAIEVKKKEIEVSNPNISKELVFLALANEVLGMFTATPLKKNKEENYKNRFLFKWLEMYDNTTLKGLNKATGKDKEKRLNTLEELRLAGLTPDTENNNPVGNFKGILKGLAQAQAVFDQDFGQNTILGPEGRTYWIYAPYNYLTKWVAELKKSAFNSAGLASSIFHQRSFWLYQLSDLHKNPDGTVTPLGPNKQTKEFGVRTFNNMKQQGGEDQGKRNIDITPADEHSLRVNQVLNNIYSPPSFADKSVWYLYSGLSKDKMNMFPTKFEFDEQGRIIISEKALNIFTNYFFDEWNRIQVADTNLFGKRKNGIRTTIGKVEDKELTEFYHYKLGEKGEFIREEANALKFSLFPSFNSEKVREDFGLTKNGHIVKTSITPPQNLLLQEKLQSILRGRISEEISSATKNGVLKRNESGSLINGSLEGIKFLEYTQKFDNQFSTIEERKDAAAQNIIAQYTLGSMIANVESMKLFLGDPAFYKSMNDMLKRTPEIIAPGQALNVIEGEITYNAAVVRDVESKSPYLQTYIEAFRKYYKEVAKTNPELAKTEAEIDKILDPYANYSETDGQGYITIQRWKYLMNGLGKWKEGWNASYERLVEGKGTDRDMELINAQPLKGMHYELRKHLINNNRLAIPTYFKYSQAVLIPQLVRFKDGTPKNELGKVLQAMEDKQIDELIFDSAVKVGAQSPAQLLTGAETSSIKNPDDLNLVPILLQNKYWKLQQDLPSHTSPTQLEGSQVKRNILSNIKQDQMYKLDGKEITGEELIRKVHEIDRILSDLGKEKLFAEFGIEETTIEGEVEYKMVNKEKLQKSLVDNFATKESTSENLLKSLDLTDDKTEFVDGLDENQFWREIDSILASMITKKTVKLEMPGGSYIQMSGFGMQKVTKYTDLSQNLKDKIQFISPTERELAPPIYKDGKFQSGGILIPSWFKSLLPREGMDGKEIYNYLKDNKLLNAVGYRIPNQGMSSIDTLRVVGFLPSAMGDTVIAYNEITAKTGGDFDIDKMYIMFPNYKKVDIGTTIDENKKTITKYRPVYIDFKAKNKYDSKDVKMLQNRKLELYQSILQSEHTFVELVTPLDSIELKNDAATVRYLENKNKLSPEAIREIENASDKKFASVVDKYVTPQEDLNYVSPKYQMEIRRTFMGGKFGVAQTARQLVDVPISQWATNTENIESPYYFPNIYLGVGHSTSENHSDLSRIYSTDGVLITGTLSARLNAYVDIAKDPYIFYLNNNTVTANTVFMLDRLGVPPQWTNFFVSQPILKDYVEKSFYNSAGTTDINPFTSVYGQLSKEYRSNYMVTLDEKINAQRKKEGKDLLTPINKTGDRAFSYSGYDRKYEILIPQKDYTSEEWKLIEDAFYKVSPGYLFDQERTASISEEIEVDELLKMIEGNLSEEEFFAGQLKMLNLYEFWQGYAKTLSEGITATKADVNGVNGGIVGASVELERVGDVMNSGLLGGFAERFSDTMLGKYLTNGAILYKALSANIFKFSFSFQGYQTAIRGTNPSTLGGILYYSNVRNTYDEDVLNQIYRDLKSIVYAKQQGQDVTLYKTPEQVEEIFYGEHGLVNRLNEYKNNPDLGLSTNFFLQYLDVELPKTAKVWVPGDHEIQGTYKNIGIEPGYIKAQKTSYKTGSDKNKLTRAWQELLNHSNPEVRAFAMELYEASFLMSGFGSTLYSFHELFPVETRRAAGINKYLMQENTQIANTPFYFLPSDLKIFYKNNWTNTKLVPEVGPRSIIRDKKPILTKIKGGSINLNKRIEKETGRPLFIKIMSENYKIDDDQFVPYVTIRNSRNGELELYEFIGLDDDSKGVYAITEKLGYSKGGKHIKEFSTDRSGLPINKFDDKVTESLTTTKRQELYKIAGVSLKYETPFGIENLIEDTTLRSTVPIKELSNGALQQLEGGERIVPFEVVEEAPKETGDKIIPFTVIEEVEEIQEEPIPSDQTAREKRFDEQYNDLTFIDQNKRQLDTLAAGTNENFWDVAEAVYLALLHARADRDASSGLLGSARDEWHTIMSAVLQKEEIVGEIKDADNVVYETFEFNKGVSTEITDRRANYYYQALYNIKNKRDKIDEGYSWFQTPAGTFEGYPKADSKLDDKLKEFLSKAGFKVEEDTLANIKRKYGVGAIGVADLINRMVTIAKEGRNIATLPEESAHIMVEMLIGKNAVVDNLLVKIDGWSKFNSIYKEYSKLYISPNGTIDMGRIRKEAVGQLIAEVMVQNWNVKQKNWFYTQVRKLINFVMDAMKGWKYFELYQEASAIADTLIEDNSKTIISQENTKPVSSSLISWVTLVQNKLDSVLQREDQSLSLLDSTPSEQSMILEEPNPMDSVFFQVNSRNIYIKAKEELSKARNSSNTRLFSFGIQDRAMASPNIKRFVEQRNFVNNLNRTKFNSTQVVQLVKNPYNPTKQVWVINPQNYKGPQLGLFEQEKRMNPEKKCD